eukprot:TRINITY_DN7023_c0_g1_i6.p2 TRINITY_DN7023_c0_g1~~TRINITY_DN7023_c0_g1_i6.p2  ORF type:complete len:111 (-),score=2.40 TRINITY_DN7023_c0_g1_i6:320-652(-)
MASAQGQRAAQGQLQARHVSTRETLAPCISTLQTWSGTARPVPIPITIPGPVPLARLLSLIRLALLKKQVFQAAGRIEHILQVSPGVVQQDQPLHFAHFFVECMHLLHDF